MRPRILVVEDEHDLRQLLKEALSPDYEVELAGSLKEGQELALRNRPDVAVLDVRLPDGSGLDLCSMFRGNPLYQRTQVIMLTGQTDSRTVLSAFDSGADDYMNKPFRVEELKARIRSKVRRLREGGPVGDSFGNMQLFPDQLKAVIGDDEIVFSTLEFSLLRFFLDRREKIANRRAILAKVWEGTVVSDRAVDAHIVSLRRKLQSFDYEIATVYGAGYVLRKKPEAGAGADTAPAALLQPAT